LWIFIAFALSFLFFTARVWRTGLCFNTVNVPVTAIYDSTGFAIYHPSFAFCIYFLAACIAFYAKVFKSSFLCRAISRELRVIGKIFRMANDKFPMTNFRFGLSALVQRKTKTFARR
jgi:ABC-type Co2+ transport system permease subunit